MSDDDNIRDFNEKLQTFEANRASAPPSSDEKASAESDNMNVGMRAGGELIVNIVVGVVIGLLLDNWLDTKPLFLIVFMLLGIAAGFWNVYKLTQNVDPTGFSALPKNGKDAKTRSNADDNDET